MAATVDLGQQLQFENVPHLPPRAPSSNGRPWSGCFHNRGRLFSTLKQQQPVSDTGSTHSDSPSPQHITPYPPSPDNKAHDNVTPSFRHRRVQSAKARLERTPTTDNEAGSDLAVFDVNMNLNLDCKPFQRHSRNHAKDTNQFLHEIYADRSVSRPSSAKACKNMAWSAAVSLLPLDSEETEIDGDDNLMPSVYGYSLQRQVFGSNPNIFAAGLQSPPLNTMFKLDETHTSAVGAGQTRKSGRTNRESFSRIIPWHMEPLRPWLSQVVSQEVIGVDPSTCLVFLPLNQTFDDLPVVPLQ